MTRPSPDEIRSMIERLNMDYVQDLHSYSGSGSVLYATKPSRLMAVTLLVQNVFFLRLQACLICGQRGDTRAIIASFLSAMLGMAELWMWCAAERIARRTFARRARVVEGVRSYVEQLA